MKDITRILNTNITVSNMKSPNGTVIPNQFIITTAYGNLFRSYDSNIMFVPNDEDIIYLGKDWNFSSITSKYRKRFLDYSTDTLKIMIEDGRAVVLEDL